MSVREYSVHIDSFARYAPAVVAEMEARVHRFVVGLGPHLIDECMIAALEPDMDISCIQEYAQNLEDHKRQRRIERERDWGHGKRARPLDVVGEFKGRQQSGQMSPPLPRCIQCGRLHAGRCQLGSDACYACGQPGHVLREHPSRGSVGIIQPTGFVASSSPSVRPSGQGSQTPAGRGKGRGGASSSSGSQNRIYALADKQDHESFPDVVTERRWSDSSFQTS
ncbi:uncharacterized protein LOC132639394 [Lycium barbarum]|uniref:uncharacterized protein LOC132639394 n=1 Tax=Lycium barbarum TaxID=112863 RepID=UPI00293EF6FD|nr:uncharacterized protein LOC132639394 [Lycium barbarum]